MAAAAQLLPAFEAVVATSRGAVSLEQLLLQAVQQDIPFKMRTVAALSAIRRVAAKKPGADAALLAQVLVYAVRYLSAIGAHGRFNQDGKAAWALVVGRVGEALGHGLDGTSKAKAGQPKAISMLPAAADVDTFVTTSSAADRVSGGRVLSLPTQWAPLKVRLNAIQSSVDAAGGAAMARSLRVFVDRVEDRLLTKYDELYVVSWVTDMFAEALAHGDIVVASGEPEVPVALLPLELHRRDGEESYATYYVSPCESRSPLAEELHRVHLLGNTRGAGGGSAGGGGAGGGGAGGGGAGGGGAGGGGSGGRGSGTAQRAPRRITATIVTAEGDTRGTVVVGKYICNTCDVDANGNVLPIMGVQKACCAGKHCPATAALAPKADCRANPSKHYSRICTNYFYKGKCYGHDGAFKGTCPYAKERPSDAQLIKAGYGCLVGVGASRCAVDGTGRKLGIAPR